MFLTDLEVRYPRNSRERILISPLEYEGKKDKFTVPTGFRTDFASIPRIFWSILPPDGEYIRAAVIHDYLYREKPLGISKEDADGIFKRIMKEEGVSAWKIKVMWRAVHWFGNEAWNEQSEGT